MLCFRKPPPHWTRRLRKFGRNVKPRYDAQSLERTYEHGCSFTVLLFTGTMKRFYLKCGDMLYLFDCKQEKALTVTRTAEETVADEKEMEDDDEDDEEEGEEEGEEGDDVKPVVGAGSEDSNEDDDDDDGEEFTSGDEEVLTKAGGWPTGHEAVVSSKDDS